MKTKATVLALIGSLAAAGALVAPAGAGDSPPAFEFTTATTVLFGVEVFGHPPVTTAELGVPVAYQGQECDVWVLNDEHSIWTGNTIAVEPGGSATGYEDVIPQATLLGTVELPASLEVSVSFPPEAEWNFLAPGADKAAPGHAGPFASFILGADCPEPEEPATTTGPPPEEPASPAAAPQPPAAQAPAPAAPAVPAAPAFTG